MFHFQWPWVTSDPDFKVTTFFEVLKTKLLLHNRKLYITYGIILCLVTSIDLLNTSRGFVSISWVSCFILLKICVTRQFAFQRRCAVMCIRAVTVLLFHFRFGFSQKTMVSVVSRFRLLHEIWVKQTITANIITLSENRANLGLYSLYAESLVNGS